MFRIYKLHERFIMFKYKILVDGKVRREGTSDQIVEAINKNGFLGEANPIKTIEEMQASVEGIVVGMFIDEFKTDSTFKIVEAMAANAFTLSAGMLISLFLEYQPRVEIDIIQV